MTVTPLADLPKIRVSDKLNLVWRSGNIDDPVPRVRYRPHSPHRFFLWHFCNPFHNFDHYVIGVMDKKYKRSGCWPKRNSNPNGGWDVGVARRAKGSPPYKFRMENAVYPCERILAAANQSGAGNGAIPSQLQLLKDEDATVRSRGAVGLDAQGKADLRFEKEILAALEDPHPCVQIVLAGIACRVFRSAKGHAILARWLQSANRHAVLLALQTTEYLRDEARPFAPALHEFVARFSSRGGGDYDIVRHPGNAPFFLEGAPLYYLAFARWTPKAQMEPDPSVHFEH